MRRRLFTFSSALSLLLFAAVCVTWVRSYQIGGDGEDDDISAYIPSRAQRYTLRSEHGVLALFTAPPAPADRAHRTAAADATAGDWARRLRNGQVVWEVEFPADRSRGLRVNPHWTPRGRRGSAVDVLAPVEPGEFVDPMVTGQGPPRTPPPFALDDAAAPLLAALEDPDRFVAAHVVLTLLADDDYRRVGRPPGRRHAGIVRLMHIGNGEIRCLHDRLQAELRPVGKRRPYSYSPSYGDNFQVQAYTARIDGSQIQAIRDMWHRRLDLPVLALAYSTPAASAPPAATTSAPPPTAARNVVLSPPPPPADRSKVASLAKAAAVNLLPRLARPQHSNSGALRKHGRSLLKRW